MSRVAINRVGSVGESVMCLCCDVNEILITSAEPDAIMCSTCADGMKIIGKNYMIGCVIDLFVNN
jgi:hypothetical protein